MRKLATIREINKLENIKNADNLLKATIDGWEIVVRKDENYNVGDKVIYIEVDARLPKKEWSMFLEDKKFLVKTIKLRGQISQGLILPLSILDKKYQQKNVGFDLTDILEITQYNKTDDTKEKPPQKKKGWLFKMLIKLGFIKFEKKDNAFPNWIRKTDENRIQNQVKLFEKYNKSDIKFTFTEKLDGSSATYAVKRNGKNFDEIICSRNILINPKLINCTQNHFVDIESEYNINKQLKRIAEKHNAKSVVLQGEIIGSKIQGNKYKLNGFDFYAFNLIIDGKNLLTHQIAKELSFCEIKTVPILFESPLSIFNDIQDLISQSNGKSILNKQTKREGFVCRAIDEDELISFKVISPEFLLKNKE